MYVNLNNIQSTLATTSNALTKPTTLTTEADAKETTASIANTDTVTISSSALELYASSMNSSDEQNDSAEDQSAARDERRAQAAAQQTADVAAVKSSINMLV
jgi:hypothetical protein